MTGDKIRIIPYREVYEEAVYKLIEKIASEFSMSIFSKSRKRQRAVFDKYWIAMMHEEVVGTIATIRLQNQAAILKRMFVHKAYRGRDKDVSGALINSAFEWCRREKINTLYLGTMNQFQAAQRFYVKKGFRQIECKSLPADYVHNELDDLFFCKHFEPK